MAQMKEITVAYSWAKGPPTHKVDAALAAAELTRIREQRGLSASTVLEESEPEDALLHGEFEWDDEAAATKYRLSQARHLIRDVVILRSDEEPIPMFVHVKMEGSYEGSYIPVTTLINRPNEYQLALNEAQDALMSARTRLYTLLALKPATSVQRALTSVERAEQALRSNEMASV